MPEPRKYSVRTRVVAWILFLGACGLWLFSGELFPGNMKLYDAIDAGDAPAVKALLSAGADPNSQATPLTLTRTTIRRYNYPPLIFALRRNHAGAALALVEAGANPNAKDLDGRTALALANAQHMPEVARALVTRGAR